MTPSSPLIPNATTERRRLSPATETLAAKRPMRRPTRLLRAGAVGSKAMWRSKQSLKTAAQHAGSTGEGTIANTAIPESP
jgi:hypothetical protein